MEGPFTALSKTTPTDSTLTGKRLVCDLHGAARLGNCTAGWNCAGCTAGCANGCTAKPHRLTVDVAKKRVALNFKG
jgi:hypothetical protein